MTLRKRYAVTLAVCTPLVVLPAALASYAAAPDSPMTAPALVQPTASSLSLSGPTPAPVPAPNVAPLLSLLANSSDPAAFLVQLGIPSCVTVDPEPTQQPVCVWNARTQGNHLGHSVLLFHDQVIDLG
jgi:hypothetical protein